MKNKPHIVFIVPRGEAVRNFLYSDTLKVLSGDARVTLLSVIDDEKFLGAFTSPADKVIPLKSYNEKAMVLNLRGIIQEAHYRWIWTEAAKIHAKVCDARAKTAFAKVKRFFLRGLYRLLANRPALEALTGIEGWASWVLRPDDELVEFFKTLKPDLVFNSSHIHGPAGELPAKTAYRLGIPTAGFIFSWDNLTTRSRITVPYNYYLVWNKGMKDELLKIYPSTKAKDVFVTGTPQFDFHFKPEFWLSRQDLCKKTGLDPDRPFIFYTTGVAEHFPEEHRTVEMIAGLLDQLDISPRPQLAVRTYVKGTSPEMTALSKKNLPGVIFLPVFWKEEQFTPMHEDLAIYTSLLRHCAMGVNAASTVSLELMMHDKPVINLGFDPPGSDLPHYLHWVRHIRLDHYRPIAESGAVMVAYSVDDMPKMLLKGLKEPQAGSERRRQFIREMFGDTLDGNSGRRVAEELIRLGGKE